MPCHFVWTIFLRNFSGHGCTKCLNLKTEAKYLIKDDIQKNSKKML